MMPDRSTGAHLRGFGSVAVMLVLASIALAPLATAGAPRTSPRAEVTIGGVSVVIVAAHDRIFAFVDRLEDNAPVVGAVVSITTAEGSVLHLERASSGHFVTPFNHAEQRHEALMLAVVSSDGSGEAVVEINRDAPPMREAPPARFDLPGTGIALVGGPVGALSGGPFLRPSAARNAARTHLPAPGTPPMAGPLTQQPDRSVAFAQSSK